MRLYGAIPNLKDLRIDEAHLTGHRQDRELRRLAEATFRRWGPNEEHRTLAYLPLLYCILFEQPTIILTFDKRRSQIRGDLTIV